MTPPRRQMVNPNALLLVVFTAVIGALCGHLLIGLAVGLGLVLVASAA